jgi:anti-sigma B factor antagonist
MPLKVKSRKIDGVVIIELCGRVTAGEPQMLLRDTVRRFVADGSDSFVFNLSDVSLIDSSGLGELAWTKSYLDERQGRANLVGLNKRVKDLLVMTKLACVFDLFEEEAKAVAALQKSPVRLG